MIDWLEIKLSDVADIIPGYAFKSKHFGDSGIPVIKIKDIDPPRISVEGADKVDLTSYSTDRLQKYWLEKGDFVVAMTGATIGKVGKLKSDVKAILNQRVAKISPKKGIDKNFVYYAISDTDFDSFIQNNIDSHSAQENISGTSIGRYPILVPSLPEQEAITAVLASLDDKIDLLHRQNKTLESLAQALFRHWFIDNAADDWEECHVRDFVRHQRQSVKPQSRPMEIFIHYSLPAFDNDKTPIAEMGSEIRSNKYKVTPFSILVSKLNPRFPRIWDVYFQPETNSICSTEFQIMEPKSREYYGFVSYLLKSDEAVTELQMAASGTSGSHQRVKPADILNLSMLIPNQKIIKQFSQMVEPNLAKIHSNRMQIRTLEKLRDTLLPKLMSGEVRVRL